MEVLRTFFSDPAMVASGLLFAAVFLFVSGLGGLVFAARDSVGKRLADLQEDAAPTASLRYRDRGIGRLAKPFREKATPKDPELRSTLRRALIQAGYFRPDALHLYVTLRLALACLAPVCALLVVLGALDTTPQTVLLAGAAAAAGGFYAPTLWVRLRTAQRQENVRDGFPDALDLLLVCVESGSSLSAAMQKVAKEIGSAYPVIAEHFQRLGLELQAGVDKATALRNMATRIGIHEVNAFVTLLIQSEALGASIADSLRVHANEMRRHRMMRAEERANRIPVKLAFPLVFFVLPSLMLTLMTPAIINITQNLLHR